MIKRLLPLGLILLLALLLTPFFQALIGRVILPPLLYGYWIGRLLLAAVPEAIFWGVFTALAALIVIRSMVKQPPPLRWPRRAIPERHQERVESWLKLLERARQETYYQWQLARSLRQLALAMVAHQEQLTIKQTQQRLLAGQLDLPPDVAAYLLASLSSFSYLSDLPPSAGPGSTGSPLDLEPERLVEFLEKQFR
ncbi:MAG TPA: hypothetical protein VGD99_15845 [Anaerolineae bacterium]|jgi:hypothetical protein